MGDTSTVAWPVDSDADPGPWPPDRERDAAAGLDVDEQRVPVRTEGRAGELVAEARRVSGLAADQAVERTLAELS